MLYGQENMIKGHETYFFSFWVRIKNFFSSPMKPGVI